MKYKIFLILNLILFSFSTKCMWQYQKLQNDFVEAAKNKKINDFKYLFKQKVDLDVLVKLVGSYEKTTALMEVAINGNLEIFNFLIESGADINIANDVGNTVLNIAITNNNFDIVKLLIQNEKLNIHHKINKTTYLIQACGFYIVFRIKNHLEIIQLLLNRGADPNTGSSGLGKTFFDYVKENQEIANVYKGYLDKNKVKTETPNILADIVPNMPMDVCKLIGLYL